VNKSDPMILLTGATGYVGRELLHLLERSGRRTRCMVRRPGALKGQVAATTEVVIGDALQGSSLQPAFRGVDTAYYLVHSMLSPGEFEREDRLAAANFAAAARAAGMRRIIYLGGLGESSSRLSAHLRSRQEVGEILRSSGIQTIEFRSSIVIGCGSFSFEMIRSLVERLPVMVTPRWVSTPTQPIAISDLLVYLLAGLQLDVHGNRIFEIGGRDISSYGVLMREYARQRGLRRLMIPVPVLTPRLSSLWLALVTPYYARVGRKLVEGLQNPTVVREKPDQCFAGIEPLGLGEAVARTLEDEDLEFSKVSWPELLEERKARPARTGIRLGTRIIDTRTTPLPFSPAQVFRVVERIGGKTGWYSADWLWQVRGLLDRLVGGVGMRRGRRDQECLREHDIVDFWRVEILERPRRLRLAAEMKLPGRAWLEFQATQEGANTTLRQTAIFDALGLWGLAYWYLLYPIHSYIFSRMLQNIVRAVSNSEVNPEPSNRPQDSAQPGSSHAG
jgi:uncharacterized protein YbjT (DUF2867 family)